MNYNLKGIWNSFKLIGLIYFWVTQVGGSNLFAQSVQDTSLKFSLHQCIAYALENQPIYKQSLIDQQVNDRIIKRSIGAWYPQLTGDANMNHYLQVPVTFFPKVIGDPNSARVPYRFGLPNISNVFLQADQVIFNNEVIVALKGSKYARTEAEKNVENSKINVIVNVGKAYYGALLSEQQLQLTNQDIERQKKLLEDTYSLFQSGVVDKLDYQRTTITLNNTLAQKKRAEENIKVRYAYLKQLMGYPPDQDIELSYDNKIMERESQIDTLQAADYNNRVEYQQLQAQMELQKLNVRYYQLQSIPSLSGHFNYTMVFQSKEFSDLYKKAYPNSAVGLRAALPIFTGFRKKQNVRIAKLQVDRMELDMDWFKEQVNTEYTTAIGSYKSNLTDLKYQKENLATAGEVYELVKLQYEQGIKTYLDVVTSESDLRSSQYNYLSALYNLLQSKLDVERALGMLNNY